LQELVEECATLPLPAPPTQKPEEKGEGGRRKEEREAGEGDRERREEEGEVMAEFENFFAPYLFLS
jgi:ribosomal protein L12E/L44/L45/RPP1/RPP2